MKSDSHEIMPLVFLKNSFFFIKIKKKKIAIGIMAKQAHDVPLKMKNVGLMGWKGELGLGQHLIISSLLNESCMPQATKT